MSNSEESEVKKEQPSEYLEPKTEPPDDFEQPSCSNSRKRKNSEADEEILAKKEPKLEPLDECPSSSSERNEQLTRFFMAQNSNMHDPKPVLHFPVSKLSTSPSSSKMPLFPVQRLKISQPAVKPVMQPLVRVLPGSLLSPTLFYTNKHPSVETMIELSVKMKKSFMEIFEEFERYRRFINVKCPPGDVCLRTRHRFLMDLDTEMTEVDSRPIISCGLRIILTEEFKAMAARKQELDDGNLHLIMEKTKLLPNHVRREYQYHKETKELNRKPPTLDAASSSLKFPNDVQIFERNNHPSIQELIDICEEHDFSFRELFEHFEQLRQAHFAICVADDTCERLRQRIAWDREPFEDSADFMETTVKRMLMAEFRKLDALMKKLTDGYVYQIMEKLPIHPHRIRAEYESHCEEKQHRIAMSRHRFPDDVAVFARNKHPTIQDMIDISKTNGADYSTVFRRFEELRYVSVETCQEGDTCQRVRRFMGKNKDSRADVDAETLALMHDEFEKIHWFGRILPLGYIHIIMEKTDLRWDIVRKHYTKWYNSKGHKNRMGKDTWQALKAEFNQNPWPTPEKTEELAKQYDITFERVRDFFYRHRKVLKEETDG